MVKQPWRGAVIANRAQPERKVTSDRQLIERQRSNVAARLEILRRRAEMTGNPLYAWEAISVCGAADFPRTPIPEWCLVYITTVASMLVTLGHLLNTSTFPCREAKETATNYETRIARWKENASIEPNEATALLPSVLGVTDGKGANYFSKYRNDHSRMVEAQTVQNVPANHPRDPLEWVMSRNNIGTAEKGGKRSASARVKRGLKLLYPE